MEYNDEPYCDGPLPIHRPRGLWSNRHVARAARRDPRSNAPPRVEAFQASPHHSSSMAMLSR